MAPLAAGFESAGAAFADTTRRRQKAILFAVHLQFILAARSQLSRARRLVTLRTPLQQAPAGIMEPLSRAELAHFKREGYVIRRGALQPELLAAARDRLWASNTSATLRRGEPASYVGGFSEADQDCDRSGLRVHEAPRRGRHS